MPAGYMRPKDRTICRPTSKSMLNGVSLHVPVVRGKLALGTWQGIYVAEHRARPHRRELILQFMGSCGRA